MPEAQPRNRGRAGARTRRRHIQTKTPWSVDMAGQTTTPGTHQPFLVLTSESEDLVFVGEDAELDRSGCTFFWRRVVWHRALARPRRASVSRGVREAHGSVVAPMCACRPNIALAIAVQIPYSCAWR